MEQLVGLSTYQWC